MEDFDPAMDYFLSPHSLARSDLMAHSFTLREQDGMSADAAAQLVFWLADRYALGRCSWLAAAAASVAGAGRYVALERADGRLAHAVLSCSPPESALLPHSQCVDVIGRRPLLAVRREIEAVAGPVRLVPGGEAVTRHDFGEGEREALAALAAALPWMRAAMGRSGGPGRGELLAAAEALGFSLSPSFADAGPWPVG